MIFTKILEIKRSKFNGELKVIKSLGAGTFIQSDGVTQSGGIVESIWKSTLWHIAYSINPKHCLILGLGGGTTAKLIKKFWPDAKITGVEIDPDMIDLGKKYLNLDKFDVDIKVTDAAKPIRQKFDLVIVDLYQGNSLPTKFTTEQFSRLVYGYVNNKGGVAVFNRLFSEDKKSEALNFSEILRKVFKKVEVFYPPANLMFVCRRDNDPED